MERRPDEELVESARGGDVEAFVALCERHRVRVWRVAAAVAGEADAEDLAQEAILRAHRALASYAGEAPFAAWLCRIALNAARDHQRSAWRRRVLLLGRAPTATPDAEALDGAVAQREARRRVRRAVAALPAAQRDPIWLHYFEGFSLAEVARLEGTPEATVRSRVRAGLRRLALSLHDWVAEGCEATGGRALTAEGFTPSAATPERPRPLEAERKGCGA
jgi:RNA polymerase sigma-70 factor (ECF subfamily)